MEFYVNEVSEKSTYNQTCIGLFLDNKWVGEGNYCGWYSTEYYLDTVLLAYGIQNRHKGHYDSKLPFDGGFYNSNQYYEKIHIGSIYFEKKIIADSIEEAIEIFKNQSW